MPSVLITGASRGIGNAIATLLAANGWDVIAGVRSEEDAARVKAGSPRIAPVILDVTNPEHIAALDDSLPDRLDAVVNNAGVAVGGPMEAVTPDELRRQFEINVIGQVVVTQAVLPRLRRSHGRIVFISSVTGKVAFPLMGPYCASKFALEAAADTLRMELKLWDIPVVIVEPAQTNTDMWPLRPPRPCRQKRGSCTTGTCRASGSRCLCGRRWWDRRRSQGSSRRP